MAAFAMRLPPGTRIDRYEVHEVLGEGGYGAVYRARHVLTEQWVALKVLRQDPSDPQGFDRLVREARAVAQLGNPHVVKIFDCGVADSGHAFLAMELLSGCDLATLFAREGPFALERSIDLALQILEGLASAHEHGIVHRDMKPANVFVARASGHDFVKILDFGISKTRRADASPLTLPGMAMGTPGYMPPEQFVNAREADARADVYATAVILYELLTRQRPYTGATFDELVVQIRAGQARPILSVAPMLPPSLAATVDRGLAYDPAGRWQSARAFADALRAAVPRGAASSPNSVPFSPPRVAASPVSATAPTFAVTPGADAPRPVTPVAAPAKDRSLRIVVAVLAIALLAALGAIVFFVAGSAPSAKHDTPAAQKTEDPPKHKAKKPKEEPDDDDEPASPKAPKSEKGGGGLFSAGGVTVDEPRIVGQIDGKEVRGVLKKALPSMKECRRATKQVVQAQAHVGSEGNVPLATAGPDNAGDAAAARCVAQRFKDAAPGWKPGGSGIIFFDATLDPL